MKRVGHILLVCVAICTLTAVGRGQSRGRTKPKSPKPAAPYPAPDAAPTPSSVKRRVVVKLKQGDPVTGNFIRADAEMIQVDVQSGRLNIRLDDVVSLSFAEEEPASKASYEETNKPAPTALAQNNAVAREALKALLKLATAAEVSLPYGQYGNLMIEIRASIQEALSKLPAGTLKTEISQAMEAYADAGQAWSKMQMTGMLPLADELAASLMQKYTIKPSPNAFGKEDHLQRDVVLSTIWAAARKHLDNLSEILGQ